jgi:hypothetical protein
VREECLITDDWCSIPQQFDEESNRNRDGQDSEDVTSDTGVVPEDHEQVVIRQTDQQKTHESDNNNGSDEAHCSRTMKDAPIARLSETSTSDALASKLRQFYAMVIPRSSRNFRNTNSALPNIIGVRIKGE